MSDRDYRGEIRDSTIRNLLEKSRKGNYGQYLKKIRLERIRSFTGATIDFDFPVTALVGPNGGGKSTIIGAAACAYSAATPSHIFRKSRLGDENMNDWLIEYELIEKALNPKGTVRTSLAFKDDVWIRSDTIPRRTITLGIARTIPTAEHPHFALRKRLSAPISTRRGEAHPLSMEKVEGIDHIRREAERILGKSLAAFDLYQVSSRRVKKKVTKEKVLVGFRAVDDGRELPVYRTIPINEVAKEIVTTQLFYVGGNGESTYSEFNFGSGEASIIRMVAEIEAAPENSLVLIEEVENGLHPVAVRRAVEYFIDVAERKNVQVVFTTHSDYALAPLPTEAIWAALDGTLQQGKLSVEVLRAVSGRLDTQLAVFVEDDFTRSWIEAIVREYLPMSTEEIGIYAVQGDGNAVKMHRSHVDNPSISFQSVCFIDGDSQQSEDPDKKIYRLPGTSPETTIFNDVWANVDNNLAILTAACQRSMGKQEDVARAVKEVSQTNRDPHLLFSQIGIRLGLVPEPIVRGAFLAVWLEQNEELARKIANQISYALTNEPTATGNDA